MTALPWNWKHFFQRLSATLTYIVKTLIKVFSNEGVPGAEALFFSFFFFPLQRGRSLGLHLFLGSAFQLDLFLHFAYVRKWENWYIFLLYLPTLLHVAAGIPAPKRVVGRLEAHQKLGQKDTVLAPQ